MKPEAQVWAEELAAQLNVKDQDPVPPIEFFTEDEDGNTEELVVSDVRLENGVVQVKLEVF